MCKFKSLVALLCALLVFAVGSVPAFAASGRAAVQATVTKMQGSNSQAIQIKKSILAENRAVNIKDFEYYEYDNTVTITKYIGSSTTVTVPAYINGKPVKALDAEVFKSNYHVVDIIIQDGISVIGSSAFQECRKLESIHLPQSIHTIYSGAFYNCQSLKSAILPMGLTKIENGLFEGCKNLQNVVLQENITIIGNNAFSGCSSLTAINLPSSVIKIGSNAFYGCQSLSSIILPSKVAGIEKSTFSNCFNLKSIILPSSLAAIEEYAFFECKNLISIDIPDSVIYIDATSFKGCDNLTSIKLPNFITEIGADMFRGCKKLVNVNIPNSVKQIGEGAFYECYSLISATIPEGITELKDGTFFNCDGLININLPSTLKEVENYVFAECESIESIDIPNNVLKIGERAFAGCNKLIKVVLPDSVNEISYNSFDVNNNNLVFYCSPGSYAYNYAKKYGIRTGDTLESTVPSEPSVSASPTKPLTPAVVKLAAPKNLKSTPTGMTSAKLSWGPVTGATGYELQRSTDKKSFSKVYTGSAKSFTDKKLKPGVTYYYRVRAYKKVNGGNVYGKTSAVITVKAALPAPTGATAKAISKTKITVSWSKVNGAAGYEIYRSTDNRTFKKVGTVTKGVTFSDTKVKGGAKYYYKVRAYSGSGKNKANGSYSKVVTITTP